MVLAEVPTVIGGRLRRIVGNKRHLLRFVPLDELQEHFVRKAFHVEFRLRKLVIDQVADRLEIGKADMPLVGTWVHGQSACSRLERDAAKTGDGWPGKIAPVAQHRDSIEIHGQFCGHIGTFERAPRPQPGAHE